MVERLCFKILSLENRFVSYQPVCVCVKIHVYCVGVALFMFLSRQIQVQELSIFDNSKIFSSPDVGHSVEI